MQPTSLALPPRRHSAAMLGDPDLVRAAAKQPTAASPARWRSPAGRCSPCAIRVMALIDKLPATDARAMHALGEGIDRSEEGAFDTFVDTARAYSCRPGSTTSAIRRGLPASPTPGRAIERMPAARSATYNLDRKPLVFTVFGLLAEVARG